MALDDILLDTEEKMMKSTEAVLNEFSRVRTGKASPDLVIGLTINAYGSLMKMREVAAVTTPSHDMIMIQPWDASNIDPIRKAIEESKIGITPQIDGKVIRLPIPPLSAERRQELVKTVHRMSEEGRVAIRANRRYGMEELKKIEKAGEITEDQLKTAEKEIQKLTDQYSGEIDKHATAKEAELMKV